MNRLGTTLAVAVVMALLGSVAQAQSCLNGVGSAGPRDFGGVAPFAGGGAPGSWDTNVRGRYARDRELARSTCSSGYTRLRNPGSALPGRFRTDDGHRPGPLSRELNRVWPEASPRWSGASPDRRWYRSDRLMDDRFDDRAGWSPIGRERLQWQTDLRLAVDGARRDRRPLLVTISADWCSYCERMQRETFNDGRLISEVNRAGLVPVLLDADADRELVSRLGIQSLPTTLIVSPDQRIAETLAGFRSPEQLLESIRRHRHTAFRSPRAGVTGR